MITSKALWHLSPVSSALKTESLSSPGNPLVVASLFSLVSQGTERTVATGQVPPSLYEVMEVPYMQGAFSFPVKYGYSLVGEVVDGAGEWLGKKVHLMHPHQDQLIVEAEDLFPLPDWLPPKRAVLISNLETALNAIWDAGVSAGDRILVVGFGGIGALVATLAGQFPGTIVLVVEPEKIRRTLAKKMGFIVVESTSEVDIAFHCSGQSAGLQTAIKSTGQAGKIIELSWYGNRSVEVQLGKSFHYGRKQLISSQVSHLPLNRSARWDFRRRKQVVLDLLKDEIWDLLLDKTVPFDQAPQVFDHIRKGEWRALNCVLQY